jgi:hypothetical protein
MLSREDSERPCRTGSGTLTGDLFRRFWLPARLASDLPGPDLEPWRLQPKASVTCPAGRQRQGGHPGLPSSASVGRYEYGMRLFRPAHPIQLHRAEPRKAALSPRASIDRVLGEKARPCETRLG